MGLCILQHCYVEVAIARSSQLVDVDSKPVDPSWKCIRFDNEVYIFRYCLVLAPALVFAPALDLPSPSPLPCSLSGWCSTGKVADCGCRREIQQSLGCLRVGDRPPSLNTPPMQLRVNVGYNMSVRDQVHNPVRVVWVERVLVAFNRLQAHVIGHHQTFRTCLSMVDRFPP